MTESGFFRSLGPEGRPAVLLVDDSWEILEGLSAGIDGADLDDFLQERLTTVTDHKARMDLDLLGRAVRIMNGRFRLEIADYAWIERNFTGTFDDWNRAVLFNLSFTETNDGELPGASLLVRLLNGCRPRAEVALLTGKPDRLERYFSEIANQPGERGLKTWLLQFFPVIIKSAATLDFHLEGFIHYFAQRFEDARRRELARAVALAQTLKVPALPGVDGTHLTTLRELELWEQRHGTFPVRDLFFGKESLTGFSSPDEGHRIESFKGVFSLSLRNAYRVHAAVVGEILNAQGFDLELEPGSDECLFLPTRPGALFLLLLARFLDGLGERPLVLRLAASEDSASLTCPLQRADIFRDALQTRHGGEVVTACRDLIAGQSALLTEMEPSLEDAMRPWVDSRTNRLPGHRPVWRPLVGLRNGESQITFQWRATGA